MGSLRALPLRELASGRKTRVQCEWCKARLVCEGQQHKLKMENKIRNTQLYFLTRHDINDTHCMSQLAPLRASFFRPDRPCAKCPRSERLKGLGPQFWLRATNHPSTAYLFSSGPAGNDFLFYVRAVMNICVECPPLLAQRIRQPHFARLVRLLASCVSPRASCSHGFVPHRGHR